MKVAGTAIGASAAPVGLAQVGAAQATPVWDDLYDNNGNGDWAAAVVTSTRDGGYAVVGTTTDYDDDYNSDYWLVKLDSDGNQQWARQFDRGPYDNAVGLTQLSDGGYAIAGSTYNENLGYDVIWVVRTNRRGRRRWSRTYRCGQTATTYAADIVDVRVNNRTIGLAVLGTCYDFENDSQDLYLLRLRRNGSRLWDETYDYNGNYDNGAALVHTSDGGFALAGSTYNYETSAGSDYLLVKTDDTGGVQWTRTYDNDTTDDWAADLVQRTNNNGQTVGYVIAGTTYDYETEGGTDYYVVRTRPNGTLAQERTYDYNDSYDNAASIVRIPPGTGDTPQGYAILGTTQYYNEADDTWESDYWLVRTREALKLDWAETYDQSESDYAASLAYQSDMGEEEDENYVLAGSSYNEETTSWDYWVVGVDEQ